MWVLRRASKGPPLFFCAPGRAHSLGGKRPLRILMAGTVSQAARVSTVKWNPKEAVGKVPARRTGGDNRQLYPGEGARISETQQSISHAEEMVLAMALAVIPPFHPEAVVQWHSESSAGESL